MNPSPTARRREALVQRLEIPPKHIRAESGSAVIHQSDLSLGRPYAAEARHAVDVSIVPLDDALAFIDDFHQRLVNPAELAILFDIQARIRGGKIGARFTGAHE